MDQVKDGSWRLRWKATSGGSLGKLAEILFVALRPE